MAKLSIYSGLLKPIQILLLSSSGKYEDREFVKAA